MVADELCQFYRGNTRKCSTKFLLISFRDLHYKHAGTRHSNWPRQDQHDARQIKTTANQLISGKAKNILDKIALLLIGLFLLFKERVHSETYDNVNLTT